MEQRSVVAPEDCVEHDIFWICTGGEHAWCCKICGYAYDSLQRAVRSRIEVFTPSSGLPDGLYRAWMPIFPLQLL
jgi:hypothetical protein